MSILSVISILRLLLVPAIVVMIGSEAWLVAFLLFVTAGATDGVNSYLARRYDLRSEIGTYLDAFADKALIVPCYVALGISNLLPSWIVILVVARDAIILLTMIISWLTSRPVDIHPFKISKLAHLAQIVLAALVLARQSMIAEGFGKGVIITAPWVVHSAMISVAILTVVSAGAYLVLWLQDMGE